MEYYWMIRNLSNVFDYRLKMAEYAQRYGKSSAAREFKTTRRTVRKWVGGAEGSAACAQEYPAQDECRG